MHTISAAKVQKYLQICKYLCFFSVFSVVLCIRRYDVVKKNAEKCIFLGFCLRMLKNRYTFAITEHI